jgi:sporulation protein YlmC with PRC-barrel domain
VLRRVNGLLGYAIRAADSEAGRVIDLRIDRATWAVSALVVDAGQPVLLSSRLLGRVDVDGRCIATSLRRAAIAGSPRVETDRAGASGRELAGHFVQGLDDDIGRVADCLVDDETWAIRHLIVDVERMGASHLAAIPVGWVTWVSDQTRSVLVALRTRAVREAPRYDGSLDGEALLAAHYGRPPFARI